MTSSDAKRSERPLNPSMVKAIIWGGLLAGALDLVFALTYYGLKGGNAVKVLQSIAGGIQGKAAYQGGAGSAFLGVALHFGIAIGAAAIFCVLARGLPILLRKPWISGAVFGAGVYYFMQLVVLPLSALKTKGYPLKWEPWMLAAHVVLIGLPIALTARRYLPIK